MGNGCDSGQCKGPTGELRILITPNEDEYVLCRKCFDAEVSGWPKRGWRVPKWEALKVWALSLEK
jgi:hypothetical protein